MKVNLKHKDEEKCAFSLRLYSSTHAEVKKLAESVGLSMQQLVVSAINDMLDKQK